MTDNRSRMRGLFAVSIALSLAAMELIASQSSTVVPSGLVVEQVGEETADQKAGIKPGDILTSWVRMGGTSGSSPLVLGEFRSPFDLHAISVQQAPRGPITIRAIRDGRRMTFDLHPDDWEWVFKARPRFTAKALEMYLSGRSAIDRKSVDAATEIWRALALGLADIGEHETASWLFLESADALCRAQRQTGARVAVDQAIRESERLPSAEIHGYLLYRKGLILSRLGDSTGARASFELALEAQRKNGVDQLQLAETLAETAIECMQLDDLTSAVNYAKQALEIRERLAPASLAVASSYLTLSSVADARSDHVSDEDYCRKALSIMELLVPGSLTEAHALVNLSVATAMRGDFARAEELQRRALTIRERFAPSEVPGGLDNLGSIARDRGDLTGAESYLLRGLALAERRRPGKVVLLLQDLGTVAQQRGDFDSAERYFRRALNAEVARSPDGPDVASILAALGSLNRDRGDLRSAEECFTSALAIRRKLTSDGPQTALVLSLFSEMRRDRGDIVSAQSLETEALAIREKASPDGLLVAASLANLARLAEDRNDPREANGSICALSPFGTDWPRILGTPRPYCTPSVSSIAATANSRKPRST